jgi:hypothetical protein
MERSAGPIIERMLNVLIHIFLHQMRKQCLEFALPNPGEICTFGRCLQFKQSYPWLLLSYFCTQKQAGKSIQRRESFKEICLRKAQHYQSSLKEEKPLQSMIPLTLLPKNHNLFYEGKEGLKKDGEKKVSP